MIVVKIELWPGGSAPRAKELGRMYLANDGSSLDPERGNYNITVCKKGTNAIPAPLNPRGPAPTRTGRVENYPRLAYNVWRLIARAIKSAFPEEA